MSSLFFLIILTSQEYPEYAHIVNFIVSFPRSTTEAFAFDDRNRSKPYFYFTEDQQNGPLRRWTPDPDAIDWENDPWSILHSNGTLDYMVSEECGVLL